MIAGIDSGLKGAIAVIEGPKVVRIQDFPTYKTVINKKERSVLDLVKLVPMIQDLSSCECVFLEKLQPFANPKSSFSANFSLGYCRGVLEAFLLIFKVRYEYVTAIEWQKSFGVVRPKGDKKWKTKGPVYGIASKLFPEAELVTPRGRLLDGRSDALLIAEWGKRQLGGKNVV